MLVLKLVPVNKSAPGEKRSPETMKTHFLDAYMTHQTSIG